MRLLIFILGLFFVGWLVWGFVVGWQFAAAIDSLGLDKAANYQPIAPRSVDESVKRIGEFIYALGCLERFNQNSERDLAYKDMLATEARSLGSYIGTDAVNVAAGAAALQAMSALGNDCVAKEQQFWNSLR